MIKPGFSGPVNEALPRKMGPAAEGAISCGKPGRDMLKPEVSNPVSGA